MYSSLTVAAEGGGVGVGGTGVSVGLGGVGVLVGVPRMDAQEESPKDRINIKKKLRVFFLNRPGRRVLREASEVLSVKRGWGNIAQIIY